MKLLRRAIENKRYALAVIAIESAVIEVIAEFRRAVGWEFAPLESTLSFMRKLRRRFLGSLAINQKNLWPQRGTRKQVEKDFCSRHALEFVRAFKQSHQSLIIPGAPGSYHCIALNPAGGLAVDG